MSSESKKIYKYVTSVKKTTLVWIIAMVVVGLILLLMNLRPPLRISSLVIGIALVIISIISIPVVILTPMRIAKERLAMIEGAPDYEEMLADFENGYRAEGDRARVGDHFFFGKGTGVVCRATDIKQVKLYRRVSKGNETDRMIVAKLAYGNTVLCEFPGRGAAYTKEPEYAADIRNVYRALAKANDKIIFDVRL